MVVEQIYTGCLAHGAYYIHSNGEAVVIDPLREVEPYIHRAERDGVKIKYIFETHFHADFVSGHLDLAEKTGAIIVYGPTAQPKFKAHVAHDGEIFSVGDVKFKLLHTPGHTMESSCYLLINKKGNESALFSGDTLFLGDVGRPDLAQKAANMTREELAGLLFDSLRNKIMPLHDNLIIYPGHGAGSACGKNMMKETTDTLGHQKKINYALRENMTREEFIAEVTEGLLPPPSYFPENAKLNKEGYGSIDKVLEKVTKYLSPAEFELIAEETDSIILDTRNAQLFCKAFIPGSINIGIDGSFAPWVGTLIPGVSHPLLIVADKGFEKEVAIRLARVGYDNILGVLSGGLDSWLSAGKVTESIISISPNEFERQFKPGMKVIDVRKESEFDIAHLENAINVPLDYINENLAKIPKNQPVYIYCAGGYRSMIACSILKARGWNNLTDISGGFNAIKNTGLPIVENKTTMKS